MNITLLAAITASVLLTPAVTAGCRPGPLLPVTVPAIELRDVSVIQALFLAGRSSGVCLEIEAVPGPDLLRRVTLEAREQPLASLLDSLLPPAPGWSVRERGGVVHISGPKPRAGLLRHRMEAFRPEEKATVQSLSLALHEALVVELCPRVQSIAGRARGGDSKNTVAWFDGGGKNVETILNMAVARSSGGVWVAVAPGTREACELKTRFWAILEFSDPAMAIPGQAEAIVESLLERQTKRR